MPAVRLAKYHPQCQKNSSNAFFLFDLLKILTEMLPTAYVPAESATRYQANEARTVAGLISAEMEPTLYDIHGFVKEILDWASDLPPHDPNFEYEYIWSMYGKCFHHMGRAGVANSSILTIILNSLGDGWDDSLLHFWDW